MKTIWIVLLLSIVALVGCEKTRVVSAEKVDNKPKSYLKGADLLLYEKLKVIEKRLVNLEKLAEEERTYELEQKG